MKKIYLVSSYTGTSPSIPEAFTNHSMALRYAKELMSCVDILFHWSEYEKDNWETCEPFKDPGNPRDFLWVSIQAINLNTNR